MIEYRSGLAADAPACATLLQDWLEATPWMPRLHSRAETETWVARTLWPRAEVRLAVEGQVLGFLALEGRREIAQLIVSPLARGRGIGAALIAWAKHHAAGGVRLWCFAVNTGALRFYAREGFAEIARTMGENDEGLPDIQLEWRAA